MNGESDIGSRQKMTSSRSASYGCLPFYVEILPSFPPISTPENSLLSTILCPTAKSPSKKTAFLTG